MHRNSFGSSLPTATTDGGAPLLVNVRLYHHHSRPGQLVLWTLLALMTVLVTAGYAGAQDQPAVDSPLGKKQFFGTARRDGVVVRAGPSVGELSVATLAEGQQVVVLSAANAEFLRILPPEGTFCLVPKPRVLIRGEAGGARNAGRLSGEAAVRIGSRINNIIGPTTVRLPKDADVTVIGEDNVYYHIIPPKDVFFYVNRDELIPAAEVIVRPTESGWAVTTEKEGVGIDSSESTGSQADPLAVPESEAGKPEPVMGDEATPEGPLVAEQRVPPVVIPTTRPAAETSFRELDARYMEAAKLPLEDQPLDVLKKEYEAVLLAAKVDPATAPLVGLIEARLQTIEIRRNALQDLKAMQAMRAEFDERQKALDAEQTELAERARDARVTVYSAVGQLQPSSLQVGGGSLFRLCDPANGRTLIYVRADGETAKGLVKHLEQFVGIKGESKQDSDLKLKYIAVVEVAAIDQKQVFRSVAAEIIPPSMLQNADAGK